NAMLEATPPRRTTRSSTRKDSDTLCSWSAMSDSANLPGKCIRWSVAIEPVTAIFMMALEFGNGGVPAEPTGASETPQAAPVPGRPAQACIADQSLLPIRRCCRSVERVATGAGALRVGVVDREALRVDAIREVDVGPRQVRRTHPVHDNLDTVEVADDVAVERTLVEEELVPQAGADARLYGEAQAQGTGPFLVDRG